MAISYDWTCTACCGPNAAGTSVCRTCGANAIISASEIESRAGSGPSVEVPPVSGARKVAVITALVAIVAGAVLERPSVPPMIIWYVGIGLMAAGGVVLGLMIALGRRP